MSYRVITPARFAISPLEMLVRRYGHFLQHFVKLEENHVPYGRYLSYPK